MIDLGNGTFKIQNDKTGETKVVSAQDLPKFSLQAPQSHQPLSPIHFQGRANQSGGLIPQDPNVKSAQGVLPDVLGTVGSIAGDVLAAPTGETAVPITGGGLGAIGGGIGQIIQDLVGGVNPLQDAKGIAASSVEQGAYGAIPGVSEGKLGMRLATRGITGAVGGGGAQMAANIKQGSPAMQNVVQSGLESGIANEIIPGGGDILNAVSKHTAKSILNSLVESQSGLRAAANKDVAQYFDKNILKTEENLSKATEDQWNNKIAPILKANSGSVNDFMATVKKALSNTAPDPKISKTKKALIGEFTSWLTSQAGQLSKKNNPSADKVALSKMGEVKRQIGKAYGHDSPVYNAAKTWIENQVGTDKEALAAFNKHYGALADALDKVKTKIDSGASAPRLQWRGKDMVAPAAVGTVAGFLTGNPALGFAFGGGAYGLEKVMQDPEIMGSLVNILKSNKGQITSKTVSDALQQLGVRLPGAVN